jgi:hypothetical protein
LTQTTDDDHEQAEADLRELLGELAGHRYELSKREVGKSIKWLGLMNSAQTNEAGSESFKVGLGEMRETELKTEIGKVLDTQTLRPTDAGSLAGKLSWAQGTTFGRVGRAMLQPVY